MPDNIDRYVPEFDEVEMRSRLGAFSREELIEMLIRSYKEKRVIAKCSMSFPRSSTEYT